MLATIYGLDPNPIGLVSITALVVCIIATLLLLDHSPLPKRAKTAAKLVLPPLLTVCSFCSLPDKFVVGQHVMAKLIYDVFILVIALDLFRRPGTVPRAHTIPALLLAGLLGGNWIFQVLVLQRFYHVFYRSPVDLIGLLVFGVAHAATAIVRRRSLPA